MKMTTLGGMMIAGAAMFVAQSHASSDYPLKVHVASSDLRDECSSDQKGSSCSLFQFLAVTVDGKKYRLESTRGQKAVLEPGDYQARITKDEHKGASEYEREYELRFPDGKTLKYRVVGESE